MDESSGIFSYKFEDMTIQIRTVTVKQLPDAMSAKEARYFFGEIKKSMDVDRPRMVLDCSRARPFDKAMVYLLLCCLGEAIKRNGDIKLSALPPGSQEIMELTGVNRIFEIYKTAAAAVDSFDPMQVAAFSPALASSRSPHAVGSGV